MNKKILITGAAGFVGRHLARMLLGCGYEVYGLDRGVPLGLPEGCKPLVVDLEDSASIVELPRDWFGVIHLAGASIPSLFATTAPVIFNLHLTMNLLEHLREARVILVSSCHVYAPANIPQREDSPLIPQGRYGLSKHLLEQLAPHYKSKLDIRIARPFNHLGPGQRPELVIPSLIRRLSTDRPGASEPIQMHGQNSVRDFIDVHDVVRAYQAILELESPSHNIFNVCTGRPCSISQVAQTLLDILGSKRTLHFSDHPISQDDTSFLVGDPARLNANGWKAEIDLENSLSAMVAAQHTITGASE